MRDSYAWLGLEADGRIDDEQSAQARRHAFEHDVVAGSAADGVRARAQVVQSRDGDVVAAVVRLVLLAPGLNVRGMRRDSSRVRIRTPATAASQDGEGQQHPARGSAVAAHGPIMLPPGGWWCQSSCMPAEVATAPVQAGPRTRLRPVADDGSVVVEVGHACTRWGAHMPLSLETRVENIEDRVTRLEELPARVDGLTVEISQLRAEMARFAARVEAQFSDLAAHMRVLHEDVVNRIALLQEAPGAQRRKSRKK
jgi:hypothetical protein